MSTPYQRPFVATVAERLSKNKPLIQIVSGPRQVGKTTGVRQLLAQKKWACHCATADDAQVRDHSWLLSQWQQALLLGDGALLVIDEVQNVRNWPETLKALWDAHPGRLRVLLLSSSALQVQSCLTTHLVGSCELIRVHHWTFAEMHTAFGYDLPRYLVFGGYPGAVALEQEPERWQAYLKETVLEAVIGKDILHRQRVGNPALFRHAFQTLGAYPAQEISYTKLLGQLQDRGNTDLVKSYIDHYGAAFLLHALQKHTGRAPLSRSSSPKMLPACPALFSMAAGVDAAQSAVQSGQAFEMAVGAELAQQPGQVFYWRDRNNQVDFVYQNRDHLYAVEVKSGRKKSTKGLDVFHTHAPQALRVVITPDNFARFSAQPSAFLQTVAV